MKASLNSSEAEIAANAPVCVVVPCFRCASTINRAIASVVGQTLKPAEIILVDDASGDGTLTALRQLEQRYSGWIKVIALDENCGAASARNAGWAVTKQPYVAFLDADDSWHQEKLHHQYLYMKNNPNIGLCGHLCEEQSADADLSNISANFCVTKISAIDLLFKTAFSTPTVMLKSDMPCRFPEGKRYAEDAFLWQQVAFSGIGVARLEVQLAYLYKARYGSGGLSSSMWKMEQGELANFYEHYKAGRVGAFLLLIVSIFSLIKYAKRMLVLSLFRMLRN